MRSTSIIALAAAACLPAALAGLEDAKHSTVLTNANFDAEIGKVSEGTLVAMFAPWCGHCKSLEPAWTAAAKDFENSSRCRIAHLDAETHRDVANRYGVKGYPTLKFVKPDGTAEDYNQARDVGSLKAFMEEQGCTALDETAGRIPAIDLIAAQFFGPTATRTNLLASASAIAKTLTDGSAGLADYYLKVMAKYVDSAEGVQTWLVSESERLGKLASKKGSVAAKKLDELRMKQNILSSFKYVKEAGEAAGEAVVDAAEAATEAVVDAAEAVVGKAKDEL